MKEQQAVEKGDKVVNKDGDRVTIDKDGSMTVKKRGPIRKSLAWIIRPGYTKYGTNPIQAGMPKGLDFKSLKMAVDKLTALEKAEYKASQARSLDEDISKMSDREAFLTYCKRHNLTKADIPKLRKGLRMSSYFNYLMNIIPIMVLIMTYPYLTLFSLMVAGLSVAATFFFTLQGMKEAWRAEQVRRRELFHFKVMFNSPLAFLY